jgi:N-methylhydantoinase A/oxoprolinase/acetone carboxylase beta subunit
MSEVLRIGVDVGGTNTDAVLLRGRSVLASHKSPTTADVGSGIVGAIDEVLKRSKTPPAAIAAVMIGTTHFTNALVEARHLCRVGILRLAAPATLAIRPMVDWPEALRAVIHGHRDHRRRVQLRRASHLAARGRRWRAARNAPAPPPWRRPP